MERGGTGRMDAGKFLNLVNRCGLELSEVDLARLTSRDLMVPWKTPEGERVYTGLHLYVMAEYFRAVRPVRHPWATEREVPTPEKIAELSEDVNRMLDAAWGGDELSREEVEEFMMGVERCLARVDPFGPLAEIFDLLRPEWISKMRNAGRLYLELKRAVSQLSKGLQGLRGTGNEGRDQRTRPMFGDDEEMSAVESRDFRSTAVIGDRNGGSTNVSETSEAAQEAIDEVVLAAEQSGARADGVEGENADRRKGRRSRTTQIIEVDPELVDEEEGLADEESEPVVLLDEEVEELVDEEVEELADEEVEELVDEEVEELVDEEVEELADEEVDEIPDDERGEAPGGFSRTSSVTKRTQALNQRLEKLSEHDRKRGKNDENPKVAEDVKEEKTDAVPPPSPAERIDELNRRREIYMKEQNWEKLVQLYEGGIGLFTNPAERQQIFLVLAMLYEVKLRDKESAFDAFGRAWKEGDGTKEGRDKAWEGLQRLSKSAGLHGRYVEWLEEVLSTSMEPPQRIRMQKELALGLFADQQYERAFESYASFLIEEPERFVTEDTLSQLERLGEHVDTEKVAKCFEKLRQSELDPKTWELIEEFAPEAPA